MCKDVTNHMKPQKGRGDKVLTIFKADIAAKYGAPVYSRHPPITATFPDENWNKKNTIFW